jgi:hypothetical protein
MFVNHNWCVCSKASCHRHSNCVLQTSDAYICLVTDTLIVSYRNGTPTYILSQTHQLCLTDITRLHMSCHRQQLCLTDITRLHMSCHIHINCVLDTSYVYICLVTDTSFVSYRHHKSTYILSQKQQIYFTHITRIYISCHRHINCVLDITRLHMSCHSHSNCVLQTSHVSICLVIDTSIVSYRQDTPTYVLSQTHQLCLTDITRLHMSVTRYM